MSNRRIQHPQKVKAGFTIVEISLATALLSILLIAISVITINIVNIYQKGTVVKSLNSVGRDLVEDITSGIEASLPAQTINTSNWNTYYRVDTENGQNVSGAVCFGQYSYIWAQPGHSKRLKYKYNNSTATSSNIRLLKVRDPYRIVCTNYKTNDNTINITKNIDNSAYSITDQPEELLSTNEVNLYLYDFTLNIINGNSNSSTNQAYGNSSEVFFSGTFTLGTHDGVDIAASNCKVNDKEDRFNYCAINKFKFAARTAGRVE